LFNELLYCFTLITEGINFDVILELLNLLISFEGLGEGIKDIDLELKLVIADVEFFLLGEDGF